MEHAHNCDIALNSPESTHLNAPKLVVALVHSRLDYGNGVLVGIPAHL